MAEVELPQLRTKKGRNPFFLCTFAVGGSYPQLPNTTSIFGIYASYASWWPFPDRVCNGYPARQSFMNCFRSGMISLAILFMAMILVAAYL